MAAAAIEDHSAPPNIKHACDKSLLGIYSEVLPCYSLALRIYGQKRIRVIGLRRLQLNALRFLQFCFSLNRVMPRLSSL